MFIEKDKIKKKLDKAAKLASFGAGIFFLSVLVWFFLRGQLHFNISFTPKKIFTKTQKVEKVLNFEQEILGMPSQQEGFEGLKKYFQNLAKEKGARYAFEFLKIAPVPPNTDLHLLGHTIGDELYKQENLQGMTACTNDFRNACSHSIVVGLFWDKGEEALAPIAEVCRKAPGSSGAYTMCFHGLGHGILSYFGYDIKKTIAMCIKTGTPAYQYQESSQCISGAVMEIVGGGFHDRDLWKAQRAKTLNTNKPLGVCTDFGMPDYSKHMCYVYLTPFLWEAVGGDPFHPTPETTKKAFALCEKIPKTEPQNRNACFGGFGKEFNGLVMSRDIRLSAVKEIKDSQILEIHNWCKLADVEENIGYCLDHAMNSLYWGGENDKTIAIRFCSLVVETNYQVNCFKSLINAAFYYSKDPKYLNEFCLALPGAPQNGCFERLKNGPRK